MAAAGHPIKGDLKYGARRSDPNGGIRLHAYKLSFIHPVTHKNITVKAPPVQPDTLWQACTEVCLNDTPFTNKEQAKSSTAKDIPASCGQIDPERRP